MSPARSLSDLILAERGHLFPWVPVCLGIGIGLYFALRFEPNPIQYAIIATLAASVLAAAYWVKNAFRPILIALGFVLLGVLLIAIRAHSVAGPVLSFRYYGPVEGRIVAIDRSLSDKTRVTLDRVRLDRVSPDRTPVRVRISLHGDQGFVDLQPGLIVATTANLSPPQGPVEPGGFDFRRKAWFDRLGGVGYTRVPLLAVAEPAAHSLFIFKIRRKLSLAMQEALPGEVGAFAAAITTGDRSGMGHETLAALRASNLAHLLAISGLHMGLLTGFVFGALRYGLALMPAVALRYSTKKIAACVALVVAAVYLALSGGNVATERAFIMVAVMLIAILLDRRALTLRAVALAAILVLLMQPEALVGPGFQMSFAATTALVAVFGSLRHFERWPGALPGWVNPVFALVLSSAIAGLATAPIGAFHFNQIAQLGLIANILSVPVMGSVVVPSAVLAALLYPFGLSWVALSIMNLGISWILGVAHWVADLEFSTTQVITPSPAVLPIIALGGLFLILWQGRLRILGLPVMLAGFAFWSVAERPAALISDGGVLLGVMTDEGRALSREKGQGFAARSWLENDGDAAPQFEAYARKGFETAKGKTAFRVGDTSLIQLTGKNAALAALSACGSYSVVILTKKSQLSGRCSVWDQSFFRSSGSVALFRTKDNRTEIVTARDRSGQRLWNTPPPKRRARSQ